jgi:HPt (histidine-containing phosphotransfer) domain-containing protein
VIEELRAKFLIRFLDGARHRLERARAGLSEGDRTAVMHEMHALAGEAGILEFQEVARAARGAEQYARRWVVSDSATDAEQCRVAIGDVESAVSALAPS